MRHPHFRSAGRGTGERRPALIRLQNEMMQYYSAEITRLQEFFGQFSVFSSRNRSFRHRIRRKRHRNVGKLFFKEEREQICIFHCLML
jgi:hypothetical protein